MRALKNISVLFVSALMVFTIFGCLFVEKIKIKLYFRSDEAQLILALLVSLNVVDCNLCVKVHWYNNRIEGRGRGN